VNARRVRWIILGVVATFVLVVAVLAGLRTMARSRTWQASGDIISRVDTKDSVVALTFDDGPVARVADSVLATLRAHNVHATFFVMGQDLRAAPDVGAALVAAGHELGNHTWTHRRMILVSQATIRDEIEPTDSLIRAVGERGTIRFRPPYGYKLFGLPRYLARTNRITVMWDIEPESFADVAATSDGIVAHVLAHVRPGSIIILHPWYPSRATTRAALPVLLDSLQARGYRVTTVGELLGEPASH
jgi:peptidoglycan/xylan/chitin deacetylase (PgdA/CDA1 family)